MTDSTAFEVRQLDAALRLGDRTAVVLDDVSYSVKAGETFGIVGESGCGKSVSALTLLGLFRSPVAAYTRGFLRLGDDEFDLGCPSSLVPLRGARIGMIFQEPRRSLDPAFSVGTQIAAILRRHLGLSRRAAWARAVDSLGEVGVPNATRRAHDYPHMFSGGMCQRVMIAMALAGEPSILIADEPTTSLDVTVQARVLDLVRSLQESRLLAVVLITHDLGVVAETCDRLAVMYAGSIVETGATTDVFEHPSHPYTEGLLESLPQLHQPGTEFASLPGLLPAPGFWPGACRFHPRCKHQIERCSVEEPALIQIGDSRATRCLRHGEVELVGLA